MHPRRKPGIADMVLGNLVNATSTKMFDLDVLADEDETSADSRQQFQPTRIAQEFLETSEGVNASASVPPTESKGTDASASVLEAENKAAKKRKGCVIS